MQGIARACGRTLRWDTEEPACSPAACNLVTEQRWFPENLREGAQWGVSEMGNSRGCMLWSHAVTEERDDSCRICDTYVSFFSFKTHMEKFKNTANLKRREKPPQSPLPRDNYHHSCEEQTSASLLFLCVDGWELASNVSIFYILFRNLLVSFKRLTSYFSASLQGGYLQGMAEAPFRESLPAGPQEIGGRQVVKATLGRGKDEPGEMWRAQRCWRELVQVYGTSKEAERM